MPGSFISKLVSFLGSPAVPSRSSRFEMLESRSMLSAATVSALPESSGTTSDFATFAVKKASVTTLKLSTKATAYGENVNLRATVAGKTSVAVPVGTITFKIGATVLGTSRLVNGVAKLNIASLAVGNALITAEYGGSSKFNGSASAVAGVTVTQAVTTNKLTFSTATPLLGAPVQFISRVANALAPTFIPTGRVSFYHDGELIGSARLNSSGVARFTVSNYFTGPHEVKAIYGGSTNALAKNSATRTFTVTNPTYTTTSSGLQTATVVAGTGASAVSGNSLSVNYTGYLTNGTLFDSSLDPGRSPFNVTLGTSSVIAGFEEGLTGMKAGETKVLVIPPNLGYGSTAQGPIPANSTLIFIVSVLSIT